MGGNSSGKSVEIYKAPWLPYLGHFGSLLWLSGSRLFLFDSDVLSLVHSFGSGGFGGLRIRVWVTVLSGMRCM